MGKNSTLMYVGAITLIIGFILTFLSMWEYNLYVAGDTSVIYIFWLLVIPAIFSIIAGIIAIAQSETSR